jgi:hypothetical protein
MLRDLTGSHKLPDRTQRARSCRHCLSVTHAAEAAPNGFGHMSSRSHLLPQLRRSHSSVTPRRLLSVSTPTVTGPPIQSRHTETGRRRRMADPEPKQTTRPLGSHTRARPPTSWLPDRLIDALPDLGRQRPTRNPDPKPRHTGFGHRYGQRWQGELCERRACAIRPAGGFGHESPCGVPAVRRDGVAHVTPGCGGIGLLYQVTIR